MRSFRAISGYRAKSLEKFRRARDGEQFGNAVGFRPIKAQRCIAFASKSWRISGRAFMFSFSSAELCVLPASLQVLAQANSKTFFQQRWRFCASSKLIQPARAAEMPLPKLALEVRELSLSGARKCRQKPSDQRKGGF